MKNAIVILIALALMCVSALSEIAQANPWVPTTAEAVMDELGLALDVPEDATNVHWQVLGAEQLAEVQFDWEGETYTARIKPAEAFEDISGLYITWDQEMECSVGRCDAITYRAQSGDEAVDLCLWYDELTGLMYSVFVADRDLDGFDILAAAEQLFVPMQTE